MDNTQGMDRVPPQDIAAEINLLCSLMIAPDIYKRVAGIVTAEAFYRTQHQQIFTAIDTLNSNDSIVDFISIRAELERMGVVVDLTNLLKIYDATPSGANAGYYAQIVAEKYARRRTIENLYVAMEGAFDPSTDIADTIATAKKGMLVSLPGRSIDSAIYPEIIDVMEQVIDSSSGGRKDYIPTGFSKIDRRINIRKGRLTVIASDPGVGKSSYVLCVMRHMVTLGLRPVLFSLEMTRKEVLENIIAQEAKVCHRDMVSGNLTNEAVAKMTNAAGKCRDLNMGVIGSEREWTVSAIRNQCISEMERGIDAVFIDSLGYIKFSKESNKNASRAELYETVCRDLVRLGAELNVPVTLTHHLNKDSSKRSKDWRPTLQSLDFAGDKSAHNVAFLYREYLVNPTAENENTAEFKIAKARDGIPGTIALRFDGPTKTFYETEERFEPPAVMAGAKQWGEN